MPERHDLVLMKTARAESHDLDAIADIHSVQALSLETLVKRYRKMGPQVMGPRSRFRLNFLAVVARIFGEQRAGELDATLD